MNPKWSWFYAEVPTRGYFPLCSDWPRPVTHVRKLLGCWDGEDRELVVERAQHRLEGIAWEAPDGEMFVNPEFIAVPDQQALELFK